VRVFRPIIADSTLELPAGGSINNETPAETAVRELAEETGIEIHDLKRFEILSPLVYTVRSPVLSHFFKVHLTGREFDMRKAHDDEIESVECFSFKDILRKIADGEIYITTPIAIITRYFIQNQVINEINS
jgi:8-oxo-dGTP pyrophosphatase MutT (NUDIX family)